MYTYMKNHKRSRRIASPSAPNAPQDIILHALSSIKLSSSVDYSTMPPAERLDNVDS